MRPKWYITAMRIPHSFWLFIVIGLGMLIAGIVLLINQHELCYGIGGFGLLWCLLLWINTRASLTKYGIAKDGLYLKRWWLKKFIPWDEIKGISVISEAQGEYILQTINDKARELAIKKGLLELFRQSKKITSVNTFLGIPVVYSESKGAFITTKRKSDINGSVVMVNTRIGHGYLISPKHTIEFVEECLRYLKNFETNEASNA